MHDHATFHLWEKSSMLTSHLEPRFWNNDHGKDECGDEEEKLHKVNDEPGPDQDPVSGAGRPDQQCVRNDQDDVDGDRYGDVVTRFLEEIK